MSDPGIKLFGRTIQLRQAVSVESGTGDDGNGCFSMNPQTRESEEEHSVTERSYVRDEDLSQPLVQVELNGANLGGPLMEDPLSGNSDVQASKGEQQQEVRVSSQEKSLKKPEKILPCPRCNSVDTKFCYYNNYNTNQPRHFCKNCQRYWTAGGTMRNVPVGAGRRKNKSSVAPFRHVAEQEALQKVKVENSTLLHHPRINTNGTALKFSSDAPLCESMVSSLSIGDKKSLSSNGFSRTGEQEGCVSHGSEGTMNNHSTESSLASPKGVIGKGAFSSQMQCFPGAPWPYPCHSDQWGSLTSSPRFAYASFPMPSYTAAAPPVIGCTIQSIWMGPWIIPPEPMPPCSGTSSPTLGKHSRDDRNLKSANLGEETLKENTSEQILWVPKTSRIQEPTNNSILSNLGIKEDTADSVGLFKSSKGQFKNKGTLAVLQANPAALSRALSFHESS